MDIAVRIADRDEWIVAGIDDTVGMLKRKASKVTHLDEGMLMMKLHGQPLHSPTPLSHVLQEGDVLEVGMSARSVAMERLANMGVLPDMYNDELMMLCCGSAGAELKKAKLLFDAGADIENRDERGYTPLHHAAHTGQLMLLHELKVAGADVNAETADNHLPIHFASQKGHFQCVRQLCLWRSNLDHQDKDGLTAMHCAAAAGKADVVEGLKLNGADMDVADHSGKLPIHHAASKGRCCVIELLLEYGTAVKTKDCKGNTPLDLAKHSGNKQAAKLLRHQRGWVCW